MADFLSLVAEQFRIAHFLPIDEILASRNRAYLDLIPRGGGGRADGFRSWFLGNARLFEGGRVGADLPAVREFLTKFGHRHKDAFLAAQALAEDAELPYWEGYALHGSLPVRVAIHHAWNTAGGEVVDVTWPANKAQGHLYLGVPVEPAFLKRIRADLAVGGKPYRGTVAFFSWVLEGRIHEEQPATLIG
jgi:hypothetical protein